MYGLRKELQKYRNHDGSQKKDLKGNTKDDVSLKNFVPVNNNRALFSQIEQRTNIAKTYVEGKENTDSVSTEKELQLENSILNRAKSVYLRAFENKETGEKVYKCMMCKVEDSNKHIMNNHVKKKHTSKEGSVRNIGL